VSFRPVLNEMKAGLNRLGKFFRRSRGFPQSGTSCSAAVPHQRLETLEPRLLLSGTIQGTVFDDLNKDGFFDPGEPGIASQRVIASSMAQDADLFLDDLNHTATFGEAMSSVTSAAS